MTAELFAWIMKRLGFTPSGDRQTWTGTLWYTCYPGVEFTVSQEDPYYHIFWRSQHIRYFSFHHMATWWLDRRTGSDHIKVIFYPDAIHVWQDTDHYPPIGIIPYADRMGLTLALDVLLDHRLFGVLTDWLEDHARDH